MFKRHLIINQVLELYIADTMDSEMENLEHLCIKSTSYMYKLQFNLFLFDLTCNESVSLSPMLAMHSLFNKRVQLKHH